MDEGILFEICRQYAELTDDKKKAKAAVEKLQLALNGLSEKIIQGFSELASDPETSGTVKITVPTKNGGRTISPRIKWSTKALVERPEAAKALLATGDPALAALVGPNYNSIQLTAYVAEQMRLSDGDWTPPAEWEGKIAITEYTEIGVTKS